MSSLHRPHSSFSSFLASRSSWPFSIVLTTLLHTIHNICISYCSASLIFPVFPVLLYIVSCRGSSMYTSSTHAPSNPRHHFPVPCSPAPSTDYSHNIHTYTCMYAIYTQPGSTFGELIAPLEFQWQIILSYPTRQAYTLGNLLSCWAFWLSVGFRFFSDHVHPHFFPSAMREHIDVDVCLNIY